MKNTQEQELIISSLPYFGKITRINAFAGTGKTSTLVKLAESYPEYRFLYLAFNRSIAQEAQRRFPSNTTSMTTHKLAYSHVVKVGDKVRGEYKVMEIMKIFSITLHNARVVKQIFSIFCSSIFITMKELKNYLKEIEVKVDDIHFFYAHKLYGMMVKRLIPITHDFYLKEYQRKREKNISFDFIMLDEGQDSNAVTIDIFRSLPGKKIIIGDTHQQIYSFRGSVDAMQSLKAEKEFNLTETFRCRPAIVKMANYILSTYKNEKKKLVAAHKDISDVKTIAYITRTNASLIDYINEFDEFRLTRKPSEIFKCSLSIYYRLTGEYKQIHPEYKYLISMNDDELQEYIRSSADIEIESSNEIVGKFKDKLPILYKKALNQKKMSTLTLSTAHSSKGLEFDAVVLSNDFPSLENIKSNVRISQISKDNEYNLLYVAVTRARYAIMNNSPNVFSDTASDYFLKSLFQENS